MTELTFFIEGTPVPWARAAGGKTRKHFTPAKQRAYMDKIRWLVKPLVKTMMRRPIRVEVDAIYPPNKTGPQSGWKITRPDGDNILKLLLDSLNNIVYIDDAQVCEYYFRKIIGHNPGLNVSITEIIEDPL